MDIILLLTFIMLSIIFIKYIIDFIHERKVKNHKPDVSYTNYLLYDEEHKKYIVKEFDDSISILGVYCNTQTGAPLLMVQTEGWIPKPNSLGSRISHYDKNIYIITSEYIFTDEESAILQAIKLNKLI